VKILIADDDRVNRLILQTFLNKWGYDVVAVEDGVEAWNHLEQPDAPRLAILDWMMPNMDGAQVCQAVRKRQQRLYTYVILLTSKGQKQDIVDGFEAGADDYLTKPFDKSELRSRVRAGLRLLEMQEQLVQAQDLLQLKAAQDGLTGLWNRGAILELLGKELARARRTGGSVGIMMVDLDHFKRVNDTYGHLAGDAVLREAAQRLRNSVRPYDAIGRYGGEEFLVVVSDSDLSSTVVQAERLRRAVEGTPVVSSEGTIGITISLGVTAGSGEDSVAAEALVRSADAALYQAKTLGRNRVEAAKEGPWGDAKEEQRFLPESPQRRPA
jgi:diguanylate cyclase (GGDEF)-like protein